MRVVSFCSRGREIERKRKDKGRRSMTETMKLLVDEKTRFCTSGMNGRKSIC